MSDEAFGELEQSLNQAQAHSRGEQGEWKEKSSLHRRRQSQDQVQTLCGCAIG
jgi:hypothetical protein